MKVRQPSPLIHPQKAVLANTEGHRAEPPHWIRGIEDGGPSGPEPNEYATSIEVVA